MNPGANQNHNSVHIIQKEKKNATAFILFKWTKRQTNPGAHQKC